MLKSTPESEFTIHAVRQASLLVKQVQAEMVSSALTKDDRSPVTVADFAAQAYVARRLMDVFPDDALVGEETSTDLDSAEGQGVLSQVGEFIGQFLPGRTPTAEEVARWIDRGDADGRDGDSSCASDRR